MRTRGWVALAMALAATTAWAQSGGSSVDPALQDAVKKFAQAFDAADPKAVASHTAADGTVINPMGHAAHGPAEVEQMFAKDGVPTFKGSRSTMTITGSRQIAPDLVWLDIDHQVQNAHRPDGAVGPMKAHMVVLAQKQGSEWKWAEMRAWLFRPGGAQRGPPPVRPK